jgi:cystathionine gamma-synthase
MQQSQSALTVAQFLEKHPLVKAVHYPGLLSHPRHDIAKRQMRAYGGVLSFELETEEMAMAVAGAVLTIQRATSLGGTETLIEHRASIEPPGRVSSPIGLLRVSVGLEDATDLIHDLDRALSIAKRAVEEV